MSLRSRMVFATLVVSLTTVACGRKKDNETVVPPPAHHDGSASDDHGLTDVADTPENEGVADFRGFVAIDTIVQDRLLDRERSNKFFLGRYLDSYNSDRIFGLPELLGINTGDGIRSGFRNGKANALNLVLWHLTFQGLAKDAASSACSDLARPPSGPYQATFTDQFIEILKPLCGSNGRAANAAELGALWDAVMDYDAPQEERDAFLVDFDTGGEAAVVVEKRGADAVIGALSAILMNPHFLIRK